MAQRELPEGVPKGAFGPRLMALVALLSGQYRLLSKRPQHPKRSKEVDAAGLLPTTSGQAQESAHLQSRWLNRFYMYIDFRWEC